MAWLPADSPTLPSGTTGSMLPVVSSSGSVNGVHGIIVDRTVGPVARALDRFVRDAFARIVGHVDLLGSRRALRRDSTGAYPRGRTRNPAS